MFEININDIFRYVIRTNELHVEKTDSFVCCFYRFGPSLIGAVRIGNSSAGFKSACFPKSELSDMLINYCLDHIHTMI